MKKLFAIFALAMMLCACGGQNAAKSETESVAEDTVALSEPNLLEIPTDVPVVIDFYATWCGPCKMLTPLMEKMEEKYNSHVRFLRVDIDQYPQMASEYGIEAVPTLVYIKASGEQTMSVGLLEEAELEANIKALL